MLSRKNLLTRQATISLAISSIILVSFVIYKDILHYTFIGSDAITFVDTSRIKSFKDIIRIFSEAVFEGTSFSNFGKFYRPLLVLYYGLDYYIWQLNPFGYHLTDLILHIAVSILVFYFVLSLTNGKQVLAWMSAIIFTIHPIHIKILPLTASSRQESTFTLFMLLSFVMFFKYHGVLPRKSRYLVLSFFCYLLALGFKESAIMFLPLLLIYLMVFTDSREKSAKQKIIMATKQCLPFIMVTLIYIAWRTYILNGLGGYFIHNSVPVASIEPSNYKIVAYCQVMKNIVFSYFKHLLFPVDLLGSQTIPLSKYVRLFILLIIVLFIPLLLFYKKPLLTKLRQNEGGGIKDLNIKLILFSIVWLLLPLSLSLFVKFFSTRYLFISMIPLSIILSILSIKIIQTVVRKIRESLSQDSYPRLLFNISLSSLILILMLGCFTVYSPFVRGINKSWGNINDMSRIFIHEFIKFIPNIPDGSRVHLHNVPQIGFHTYTLQSWLNLTHPSKNLTVFIVKSRQKADISFNNLNFQIENRNGRDIVMNVIYDNR